MKVPSLFSVSKLGFNTSLEHARHNVFSLHSAGKTVFAVMVTKHYPLRVAFSLLEEFKSQVSTMHELLYMIHLCKVGMYISKAQATEDHEASHRIQLQIRRQTT
jgi:hypothetical protein